jgi:CRP-like cAMP-binding protein
MGMERLTPELKKIINKKNEKIQKYILKKSYKKAIFEIQDLMEMDPNNLKFMQKLGDLYNLAGQRTDAVDMYFAVAEKYLKDNYLLKAMALFKSIVRLDPTFKCQNSLNAYYSLTKLQKKMKKEEGSEPSKADDFDYPVITRAIAEDVSEDISVKHEKVSEFELHTVRTKEEIAKEIESSLQKTLVTDVKEEEIEFDDVIEKTEAPVEFKIDLLVEEEVKGKSTLVIPLFKDLEPKEFEEILAKLVVRTFLKDEVILKQGEKGNSMFFITSGKVKVTYEKQKGVTHELAVLADNDFFGEFTLFFAKTRQATVTAITDIETLELSVYDLREIIKKYPHLSQTLYQFYRERVLEIFLTISPIFGQCDIVGRRVLAKKIMVKKYPSNLNIFRENEISPYIYLIKKGKVNLLASTPSKMLMVIKEAQNDEILGEIIPNISNNFSAVAIEETEMLLIEKDFFVMFLERYPKVKSLLEEIFLKRIEDKNNLLKPFIDGIPNSNS